MKPCKGCRELPWFATVLVAALVWPGIASGRAKTGPGEIGGPTEHALDCSEKTTAAVSARPAEPIERGASATVNWSVTRPSNCAQRITLDGREVAKGGSLSVTPLVSTTYTLRMALPSGSKTLGSARVTLKPLREGSMVDISESTGQWKALLVEALATKNVTIRLAESVDMDLSGYENVYVTEGVTLSGLRHTPGRVGTSGPGKLAGIVDRPLSDLKVADVRSPPGAVKPPPTRPSARTLGPRLYTKTRPKPLFRIVGDHVRFLGFRLHGPHFEMMEGKENEERGITIQGVRGIEIADMEVAGWSGQAIYVVDLKEASRIQVPEDVWIHDNFLHHNQHDGGNGYGIDVTIGAYVLIERNLFDFNRHSIAASGKPCADGKMCTGYRAHQNLVLKGGGVGGCPDVAGIGACYTTHSFDVHGSLNCSPVLHRQHAWNCGPAGEEFWVTHNAFQFTKDHAFDLRGHPSKGATVENNVFAHGKLGDAVRQRLEQAPADAKRIRFGSGPTANTTGFDSYGRYGVCDFDGDGRDDLFLPTGVTWWYSSYGKNRWSFLNAATERLEHVLLGDFDGDARCDVLTVNGPSWMISSGGTSSWRNLGPGAVPIRELRVGDFDGDGRADVFRVKDRQWSYAVPGKSDWKPLESSDFPLTKLRFGNFVGDRRTDVLSLAGGNWSVSDGGTGKWQKLNSKRSDEIEAFVIADVHGDGRDDVLVATGRPLVTGWKISEDGKGELRKLDLGGTTRFLPKPGALLRPVWLWGRFDGLAGADVLAIDPHRMGWISSSGREALRPYGDFAR